MAYALGKKFLDGSSTYTDLMTLFTNTMMLYCMGSSTLSSVDGIHC